MLKRRKIPLVYLVLLTCGIFYSVTEDQANNALYRNEIEKMTYQLNYYDTYSPVFSPFNCEIMRTAGESEGTMEKTAYLTFDDGPTMRTPEILDILKKYNVKATFFVIKTKDEYTQYMKRAAEEGHSIAVHSASHSYREIYSSVDAYLQDFTRCFEYIHNTTGIQPTVYRFPGGSVNNYNATTRKDIVREMNRRGFIYFDWNVESGDSGNLSAEKIYSNVINGCKGKQRAVILMHDSAGKKTTVSALENILIQLKKDGWRFDVLTNEVKPVIFRMK